MVKVPHVFVLFIAAAFLGTGPTLAQSAPPMPSVTASPMAKKNHPGCQKANGCPKRGNKAKASPKPGASVMPSMPAMPAPTHAPG